MSSRITIQGRVGPIQTTDGAEDAMRIGKDGSQIVCDGHGRYYEATSRGRVFSGMTAPGGTTGVAANNTPIAAAAASILTVYNPLNSGVNLEILKAWLNFVSGTPAAGAYVYNYAFAQNITATQNNGGTAGAMPQANIAQGGSSAGRIFTQTALTGGVGAQVLLRPFGASLFAAAIGGTTPQLNFLDLVDGEIVLPPGALLSIAAPGTGTSVIVVAGFTWQEVPTTSPAG